MRGYITHACLIKLMDENTTYIPKYAHVSTILNEV